MNNNQGQGKNRPDSGERHHEAEALLDPYGFGRFWSDRANDGEQGARSQPNVADPRPQRGEWTAAATSRGGEAVQLAVSVTGLALQLVGASGKVLQHLVTGPTAPRGSHGIVLRLYNAANGPLAEVANDALENESLLRLMKQLSDRKSTTSKVLRGVSEQLFTKLQLSTASDVERLARLIVNLDDKVDRLEEDLEEDRPNRAHSESRHDDLQHLRQHLDTELARLERLEDKLDRLLLSVEVAPDGREPARSRNAGRSGQATRREAEVR